MKKGNILDIGITAVRDLGKTNMLDKKEVQFWAYHLGFYELVSWIQEASNKEYVYYLNSVDMDVVPEMDFEEFDLTLNPYENHKRPLGVPEVIARQEVVNQFEEEVKEYKGGFKMLKKLPFSMNEFVENFSGRDISTYINSVLDDHAMNYVFFIGKEELYDFDGVLYTRDNTVFTKLDGETWLWLQKHYESLNESAKEVFDSIDEDMRLAALMAK